jgi:hypothetical protein
MPQADGASRSGQRWPFVVAALGLLLAVPGAIVAILAIADDGDDVSTAEQELGFDPEELFVSQAEVTADELAGTYRFVDVDDALISTSGFFPDAPEEFIATIREQLKEQLRQRSRVRIEPDGFISATRCEGGIIAARNPATIDPTTATITLTESRTKTTVQSDSTTCGTGFDGVTVLGYTLSGMDLTLTIPDSGSFYLQKASD